MVAQLPPLLVLTYTCVYSVSVKLIDLPFLQLVQIKSSSTITFKNELACLKSKFLTKHMIVCCNYPRKCTKYAPRREKTCLRWFANNTVTVIRVLESIIPKLATGKKFIFLASLHSCGDWFESFGFVGNPVDRFCCVVVHITHLQLCTGFIWVLTQEQFNLLLANNEGT